MHKNQKNKIFKKSSLTEPIIVSGKYFGIKLLSAYDFMLCSKMLDRLTAYLLFEGFDKTLSYRIAEKACVVAMCLYDSENCKIFRNGLEVLKNLTPDEIKLIYTEYVKLIKKIIKRDKVARDIFERIKKNKFQNIMKSYDKFIANEK